MSTNFTCDTCNGSGRITKEQYDKQQQLEQRNRELVEALEKAYKLIKDEAKKAMRNGANRDVVDYYDDFAYDLKQTISKHSAPAGQLKGGENGN